tara:strand:- start:348 stop:536 length:189 start_codon:yes stop_codon:yes gene_type:complete
VGEEEALVEEFPMVFTILEEEVEVEQVVIKVILLKLGVLLVVMVALKLLVKEMKVDGLLFKL